MKHLLSDLVPSAFELSWNDQNKSLVVSVFEALVPSITKKLCDPRYTDGYIKDFGAVGIGKFKNIGDHDWGFRNALKNIKPQFPGYLSWEIKAFRYKRFDEKRTSKLLRISASLAVLFNRLQFPPEDLCSKERYQLAVPTLATELSQNGGSLSVYIGRSCIPWLRSFPENRHLTEIIEAMRDAYSQMNKVYKYLDLFDAAIHPPQWIFLQCPGNACDLGPSHHGEFDACGDYGYELTPHNIDRLDQQFTLLVGIAKMCDLVREFNSKKTAV